MHIHRVHPLRRHDDPVPAKVLRSLVWLVSAFVFAFAVFGFLRDAEAQGFTGFSLADGAGGRDYYSYGGPSQEALWVNMGIQAMQMGAAARMQRERLQVQRQLHHDTLNAQYGWTPEYARSRWGQDN